MRWLAVLAITLLPSPCFAWAAEGHRIVADIAAANLTPAASAQVLSILGGTDPAAAMEGAAIWADQVRLVQPFTTPWHFVDIPIGAAGYDAARDCPRNFCVVGKIVLLKIALADPARPAAQRLDTLRYLIHFVGDLHQPLHASNNKDHGGNDLREMLRGKATTLHAIWDYDAVLALGSSAPAVAATLNHSITAVERRAWAIGTTIDWANQSYRIARGTIYPVPAVLPADYDKTASKVVSLQLKRAGIRLAAVLNAILKASCGPNGTVDQDPNPDFPPPHCG